MIKTVTKCQSLVSGVSLQVKRASLYLDRDNEDELELVRNEIPGIALGLTLFALFRCETWVCQIFGFRRLSSSAPRPPSLKEARLDFLCSDSCFSLTNFWNSMIPCSVPYYESPGLQDGFTAVKKVSSAQFLAFQ